MTGKYSYNLVDRAKKLLVFFWYLHSFALWKNRKFKNLHKGETCLIFGNGSTLKKLDFNTIKKIPSIGCTYSLIDKRFRSFGLDYCAVPENYFFYPIRRDSYLPKIVKNYIGRIMLKIIKNNKKTQFFCSLTNFYAFQHLNGNVNYFYHFGSSDSKNFNLAGKFSSSTGALDMMIGLAKYMGFSKAVLVGCDYLGDPAYEGHFYSDSNPYFGKPSDFYQKRIKHVAKNIELLVLFPRGVKSKYFNWMSYDKFFGQQKMSYTNLELIDDDYLSLMRNASEKSTQMWM